jgi:hypothetical protein
MTTMPIALTCDCGARFESEAPAGQKVNCPECLQPLEVPAGAVVPPRASLLALASVVLALVGGFTVVGGLAAVVLGLIALVEIRRSRDRLTGSGLAVSGVVAGMGFTCLTLFLFLRRDLIPIDGWWREHTLGVQVDSGGAAEVVSRDGNLVLKRPSERWGRVQGDRSDDPAVGDVQQKRDLLLANVARHAFVDVARVSGLKDLAEYDQGKWAQQGQPSEPSPLARDLQPPRPPLLGDDEDGTTVGAAPKTLPAQLKDSGPAPEPVEGWEVKQWLCEVNRGDQKWRFLIRAFKRRPEADPRSAVPVYVVRGYAPARRFQEVEKELRAALDSVRLPK